MWSIKDDYICIAKMHAYLAKCISLTKFEVVADGCPNKGMTQGSLIIGASRILVFQAERLMCQLFASWIVYLGFFFSESAEIRWLSSEFHPLESVDFCSFLVPYLIFFVSWKESRACLEGSLHWSFSVFCWVRFTVWLWKWTPTYQQLCTLTNLNLFGRVLTFYAHSRF